MRSKSLSLPSSFLFLSRVQNALVMDTLLSRNVCFITRTYFKIIKENAVIGDHHENNSVKKLSN